MLQSNLTQDDYDALIRDAMSWRHQQIKKGTTLNFRHRSYLDTVNHPAFRIANKKTHDTIHYLIDAMGMSPKEAIGWVKAWAGNHGAEGD